MWISLCRFGPRIKGHWSTKMLNMYRPTRHEMTYFIKEKAMSDKLYTEEAQIYAQWVFISWV